MDHSEIVEHFRTVGGLYRVAIASASPEQLTARDGDEPSLDEQLGAMHRYSIAMNRWIDAIITRDRPSFPEITADLPIDAKRARTLSAGELIDELDANSRTGADKLVALGEADWLRECVRRSGDVTELEGLVGRIAGKNLDLIGALRQLV